MKNFYRYASYALFFGILHCLLTPFFYSTFNQNTIWFLGSGLALIFLGFMNIFAEKTRQKWMLGWCFVCNLTGLAFGIGIVFVMPVVQSLIALIIFGAVLMGSAKAYNESKSTT